MSGFIQVGGHVAGWIYGLRVVGPIALVSALWLYSQNELEWAYLLGSAAIAWFAALEVFLFWRSIQRRCLCDTGDGFIYRDRRGERIISDEQVTAFSLHFRDHFAVGALQARTRYLLLWVLDEGEPLLVKNRFLVYQPDPLASFVERVVQTLFKNANAALERGGESQGEGWQLNSSELTIQRGRLPESILVQDLAAVDVFGRKLCLWRRGDDLPLVKIPIAARNAHLLRLLLDARIQRPTEKEAAHADGLGRTLFERRAHLICRVIAAVPAAFGAYLVCGGLFFWEDDSLLPALFAGLMFGVPGWLFVWHFYVQRFRCHELGVHKAGLLGQRSLYYRDVASFTYAATRHLLNGAYTTTILKMRFVPRKTAPGRTIRFSGRFKNVDEDLDVLRDHISGVLAARMRERLAAGKAVPWTWNLTFHPQELEFRPRGLIGARKQPQRVPYAAISTVDIRDGVFRIWRHGATKPFMQEHVDEANFFPGYVLLLSVMQQPNEHI